jgi:long-subunit fatty acid transport protein
MKNLFLAAMLGIASLANAQTLGYNDIGVLFSSENTNGTARFNSMSGAFGALGGDLSAMEVNPAGAAVFLKSEFGISFQSATTETMANFYGNSELADSETSNITQAGGVFVFSNFSSSNWTKVALGFNYSMVNDFENQWFASGNSGYAPITDLYDPDVEYGNLDGQYFENYTDGRNNKYSFTFASEYNDNLLIGAAINTYDVEYFQQVTIDEENSDQDGNIFDVNQIQELFTYGDGISFNLGIISKPNDNVRLGLAYQSPVWFNFAEDYVDYDVEIYESIDDSFIDDYSGIEAYDYELRTPSKLTGSFAYIFDRQGLISIDYSYKNYSNIKLSKGNFTSENQDFETDLQSAGTLKLGTEWRFDNVSVRGGYSLENSPYKAALESDNIEGYSLGVGLKFRGGKFDLSYQNSTNTAPYNFYSQYPEVDAAELDIDNHRITATLVLNI